MNRQELLEQLEFLYNPEMEIGISMYCIIDSEDGLLRRKADISPEVRTELKTQFLRYIDSKFIQNQDLHFVNLSQADNRKNAAYYYDIPELPEGLEVMDELLANEETETFNFEDDTYDDIVGFVFLLGNEQHKIALYKKQYPISLMKRDSILMLWKADERLVKVSNDIIRISESFEFMQIGNDLIVVNLKTLEKNFGFENVIRSQATQNINIINESNLLSDTIPLEELALELKFARKLMKVRADSPVLLLPFNTVKEFIVNHPKLRKRIRFNEQATRISLDTRVSKELFIKLLDDDFLKSELTNFLYETDIKDKLSEVEEID